MKPKTHSEPAVHRLVRQAEGLRIVCIFLAAVCLPFIWAHAQEPVQPLSLSGLCTDDPVAERKLLITNPNSFDVPVRWENLSSKDEGELIAVPGETMFTVENKNGNPNASNPIRLFWEDENGKQQFITYPVHGQECACVGGGVEILGNLSCGLPTTLTAEMQGVPEEETFVYEWELDGQVIGSEAQVLAETEGTYEVTVTYGITCEVSATLNVLSLTDAVSPEPTVNPLPELTVECGEVITTFPTAEDNCDGTVIGQTTDDLIYTETGPRSITWVYSDAAGNSFSQIQDVLIVDSTDPVALAQNITVQLDETGNVSITAEDIDNGSNDACGPIGSRTLSRTTFDCTDTGAAQEVTLTVTDGSGNESTAIALVTVEDNVGPVAVAQNITVQLDATGNVSITAEDIDNGSNDACGPIASRTLSRTTFDCTDTGAAQEVTLTVTDGSSNESTATGLVTVEDNVGPVAVAQDITVQLDATGNVSTTAEDIDNGSTDACGSIASRTLSRTTFDCTDTGAAQEVTLTVTDGSGNESTATALVTVEDNVGPVASAQNITVQLDETGNVSITAEDIDNGSNDACGSIASRTLSRATFDCTDTGAAQEVTLTVTDGSGNESTAMALVTVEDNVGPVAVAQNITVQLDETGNASITAEDIDNGSTDACGGIASRTLSRTTFDCTDTGAAQEVTLTVTDGSSNESTAIALVTVDDNVGPVAVAQNITVQLDETGNASITAEDIDNGSNDACGPIASRTLSRTTFDCTDTGAAQEVTLTVTDGSDNESTATSLVTVEDNVGPVAVAQDITVQLDATGNVSITAVDIDNGSTDACGPIGSRTLSRTTFDCTDTGAAQEVTLTVIDGSGNESTATALVTVEDNVGPVASAQNITVQLDETGNVSITAEDIDNGSTDACGSIASRTLSRTTFDCTDTGAAQEVTLTVIDGSGNESTATSLVTVEDNVGPVAVAQNITVQLDETGNVSITAEDIDNGSADACGAIASLQLDRTTFDCEALITAQLVTLTAIDASGNEGVAFAQVTVEDPIGPVPTVDPLPDITLECANLGEGLQPPTAVDNCAGIIAATPSNATEFGVEGTYLVDWVYDDGNGNTSSQMQTVIFSDPLQPVLEVVESYDLTLGEDGTATLDVSDLIITLEDNCPGVTASLIDDFFDCSDIGVQQVTVIATDVNGNSVQSITNVQVIANPDALPTPTIVEERGDSQMSFDGEIGCYQQLNGMTLVALLDPKFDPSALTFDWAFDFTPPGAISGTSSPVLELDATASLYAGLLGVTVTLTVTNGENGCEAVFQQTFSDISEEPVCPSVVFDGADVIAVENPLPDHEYLWSITTSGEGWSIASENPSSAITIIKGTGTAQFNVEVTDTRNECTNTNCDPITVTGTSSLTGEVSARVLEAPEVQYSVSPNPMATTGKLEMASDETQEVQVGIYSMTNQKMMDLYSGTVEADKPLEIPVDMTSIPPGLYFIQIWTKYKVYALRIVHTD